MPIRNFLNIKPEEAVCHDGQGLVKIAGVYAEDDFKSGLRFIHFTTLPPNATIGLHKHENDEEVYVILEGNGVMEVDGEKTPVSRGDTILNRPFGTHALYNTSDVEELKILVFMSV